MNFLACWAGTRATIARKCRLPTSSGSSICRGEPEQRARSTTKACAHEHGVPVRKCRRSGSSRRRGSFRATRKLISLGARSQRGSLRSANRGGPAREAAMCLTAVKMAEESPAYFRACCCCASRRSREWRNCRPTPRIFHRRFSNRSQGEGEGDGERGPQARLRRTGGGARDDGLCEATRRLRKASKRSRCAAGSAGDYQAVARLAVSGTNVGPSITGMFRVMGRGRVVGRLGRLLGSS